MLSMFKTLLRFAQNASPQAGDVPVFNGRSWYPQAPAAGAPSFSAADLVFLREKTNYVVGADAARTVTSQGVRDHGNTGGMILMRHVLVFDSHEAAGSNAAGLNSLIYDFTEFTNLGLICLGTVAAAGTRGGLGYHPIVSVYEPNVMVAYPWPTVLNGAAPDVQIIAETSFLFGKAAA